MRPKMGSWLDRVLEGEDIGVTWKGKIIALRAVEVHSDDYVLKEYGLTPVQAEKALRRAEGAITKDRRAGRMRKYDGNLRRALGG